MRGVTAAPALGSVLAIGLPEPVTAAPAACGALSAGSNVIPVPPAPAVPIAVILRDSRRSPPSPVSTALWKRLFRCASNDQHDERAARQQPAGGEQQRPQRLGIGQVRVIHDHDGGSVVRDRADQLQQLQAQCHMAAGSQRLAPTARGAEQLVGQRERHMGLRFVTARTQDPRGVEL